MTELQVSLFDTRRFMPHGHCYLWTPEILWLNVIPDLLIALAYFAIPFLLIQIARRRRDLPFSGLFVCFGIFIVSCGITHVLDVWNVWHTEYWLEGAAKLVTAAASVPTAVLLWRAWPAILALPSQQQLREANASLARANRELEAFTASASHDLRSPLSTIAGQVGMLRLSLGESLSAEQARRMHRIDEGVKKMSDLIDALLALSRISRQEMRREPVDISELAQDVVSDLQHAHPDREVTVTIQPGMSAQGDRRLIRDALANLIGNAWKFTRKTAGARIEIGEQPEASGPGEAAFFVRDNGAGFAMEQASTLFQPFKRLHAASEFEGSGLGLATVHRIVERHGGLIRAEAAPELGATFLFTLPAGTRKGRAAR